MNCRLNTNMILKITMKHMGANYRNKTNINQPRSIPLIGKDWDDVINNVTCARSRVQSQYAYIEFIREVWLQIAINN